MTVLAWWLIPALATLGAVLVMTVANRPRGPGPSDRSVEEFRRFRNALEQQVDPNSNGRREPAERRAPDD